VLRKGAQLTHFENPRGRLEAVFGWALRLSDIAGFLAHFDEGVKQTFRAGTLGDPSAIAFSNIVTARHDSAHGKSFQMTLRELLESFDKANRVLEIGMQALTSVVPNDPTP
jgi:hypothetical protein